MAKDTVNLFAESDRNILSDDTNATLTLENTSTGNILKLQNTSPGGVQISSVSAPTTALQITAALSATNTGPAVKFDSGASIGNALSVGHTVLASPTVAVMSAVNSAASGPVFEFRGFLSSAASAGSIIRAVRVKIDSDLYGWLPVYSSVTYI